MNDTTKRYIISSVTTFLTAFFLTLASQFATGALTVETLNVAFVLSLIAIASRAGVKAVVESFTASHADK